MCSEINLFRHTEPNSRPRALPGGTGSAHRAVAKAAATTLTNVTSADLVATAFAAAASSPPTFPGPSPGLDCATRLRASSTCPSSFHGGVSDIELTVEVKDTLTGTTREYAKPAGSFLGAVDRETWKP